MPLILKTTEQQANEVTELPDNTNPVSNTYSTGEVLKAAFQKENIIGSAISNKASGYVGRYDPSFNPFDEQYLRGYEAYSDQFAKAKNKVHADLIKAEIDKENNNRRLLDEAGGKGTLAQIAAGVLDPITIGSLALGPEAMVGKTLLQTAGKSAVIATVDQLAREAVLNPTQQTRSIQESALNVGTAAIMGSLIGPTIQKLSPTLRAKLTSDVQAQINPPIPTPPLTTGNAGAAKVVTTTLEDEALPTIEGLAKRTGFSPNERLATSPSVEVRQLHQQLADDAYRRAKNFEGVATPVAAENAIKRQTDEILGSITELLQSQAKGFRNGQIPPAATLADELQRAGAKGPGRSILDPQAVIANPKEYMTDGYFKNLVAGALRNGDKSAIPEVQNVAQFIRKKGLDSLKQAALERGLFDDVIASAAKKAAASARVNSPVAKAIQIIRDALPDASLEKQAAQLLRLKDDLFALKALGKESTPRGQRLATAITTNEQKLADHPQGPSVIQTINDEFSTKLRSSTADVRNVAVRRQIVNDILQSRLGNVAKLRSDLIAKRQGLAAFAKQAADDARQAATLLKTPTADSYLHRMWDVEEIVARRDDFLNRIEAWVKTVSPNHDDPRGVAKDFYDSLVAGHNVGLSNNIDLVGKAGPLKERLMLIPDNQIADFLDNDVERIMHKYVRDVTTDVVFHDTFGDKNLTSQLAKVNEAYTKLADAKRIEMHNAGESPEAIHKAMLTLDKRRERDISDLQWLAKRIQGKSESDINVWTRTLSSAKKFNAMRSLGGMTIASIPDLGRLVWANGLNRFARGAFNLATSSDFRKLTLEEAKRIGHGYEMVLNGRLQGMGDFMFEHNSFNRNAVEKGIDYLTQRMGLLSLMSYWNKSAKHLAGVLHADRMAEDVLKYQSLPKNEVAYLAQQGIDTDMAKRIAAEISTHGKIADGFHMANVEAWTDEVAKDAFANAVYKTVNHTINTPNAGTIPRWFRESTIGSTFSQFKSFLMAMHEQTVLAGIQEHDAKALQGAVTMLAMGALAHNVKMVAKGQEMETDPAKLTIAALDVSGLADIPWEVNNLINSAHPSSPSVQHLIGIEENKRFREMNLGSYIAGPMGGLVQDVGTFLGDSAGGEIRQRDVHALRRLMPFQNIFWLRHFLDEREKDFNSAFGISK